MTVSSPKRGFTIVELLVTITIIAILVSIGLVVYADVLPKARDAKRKQDLQLTNQALKIYHEKNGRYPCTTDRSWSEAPTTITTANYSASGGFWINDNDFGNCGSTSALPLGSDYISEMPQDPKENSNQVLVNSENFGYGYWAGNPTNNPGCPGREGQYHILFARLESSTDPDRHEFKKYKDCQGNELIDSSNNAFKGLYFLTSQD